MLFKVRRKLVSRLGKILEMRMFILFGFLSGFEFENSFLSLDL